MIGSILTFLDRSMPSLEEIFGDSVSDRKSLKRQCLSESMFAIKVNKVLSASALLMMSTCVNTTLKQVPKAKRARKLSAQACCKSTSRVLSKLSETITMDNSQIISLSTEMELEIQWELKLSVTSWSNWTRLYRWNTIWTEMMELVNYQSTLSSSSTSE